MNWYPFLLAAILGPTLWSFSARAADPSDDPFELDDLRVKITESLPYVEMGHGGEGVLIMRHQDPGHSVEPPYAKTSRDCPPFCVQPMTLAPGVETIAELELLEYLRKSENGDEGVMVIDARTAQWTVHGTIPGSVNIPYTRLDVDHTPLKAIAALLALEFGAQPVNGLWSFSGAKTLVFFCNGSWCGQSPTSIKALLDLGYPAHKLKWYRGGMQAWEQLGLTTVTPDAKAPDF